MNKAFKTILQQIATESKLHTSDLYLLSRMDEEALYIFKDIWPTIAVERRRNIIQELMEIAEINFEVDFDPIFLLGLGDEDAQVRATSIRSLWEYEYPSLIRPLIHLLKTDEAAMVREAAATALGKFIYLREIEEIDQGEAALAEEALFETIYQGNEELDVRRRAVESIGFSGDPRVTQIIEAAYYDDNDKMRVSAIFAMGRNADSDWIPQVMDDLDNENAEFRFESARACGELEARAAVSKLAWLVQEDPDVEVQQMAIWALGRIGGDQARAVLEDCLDSGNEALIEAAQVSLDELNLFDNDELMLYDFDSYDDYDSNFIEFLEDDFDGSNGSNGHQIHLN